MSRIFVDPYVGVNLRLGRHPYADFTPADAATVTGSEVAAEAPPTNEAFKSIAIGVATGAITFVVTRMLERLFK